FEDLSDFIKTHLGVEPELKEVNIGETEIVSQVDHDTKETVRSNLVTVRKTLSVRLTEMTLKHDQILQRLSDLNISLG
ncbi:hypothetical protein, partial [Flavobacterium sp.]|uniref:DUF7194 family protein n=1 Tax=Flavobacterium sp. TaxID=239 RepID=UPI0037BFFD23